MKKKRIYLHYIIFMVFCQFFGLVFGQFLVANAVEEGNASGLTSKQRATIVDHCSAIKENLQNTQRSDARTRVYLGRYYETILMDFITPLNLRLVENNISNAGLIENQSTFASQRTAFIDDYISYQQGLETLVAVDCKSEPDKFYDKLTKVRELRAKVKKDTEKLRVLVTEHSKLVKELEAKL